MQLRIAAALVSGVIMAGALPATAQVLSDPTPPPAQTGTPKLVFTSSSVDFGKISDQNEVEHIFEFSNTGNGNLVIREARGSCGCTVPALSKRVYTPGESGTLKVVFNPKNRQGKQNQTVTVSTNDPARPVIRLNVAAEIEPRTMVDPRQISMGFVEKGKGAEVTVNVSGLAEGFDVTKAWVEFRPVHGSMQAQLPDWELDKIFRVEMGEMTSRQAGERTYAVRPVKVMLAKDAPIAQYRNIQLVVEHNDPSADRFELPIIAHQLGDITLTPPRLNLGRMNPGQSFERYVIIRTSSGEPFEIKGVEHLTNFGDKMHHTLEPVPDSNGSIYKLTLRSDGLDQQGAVRGRFRIQTNVEDEEKIEYSYVGAVMQPRPANLVPTQPTGQQSAAQADRE